MVEVPVNLTEVFQPRYDDEATKSNGTPAPVVLNDTTQKTERDRTVFGCGWSILCLIKLEIEFSWKQGTISRNRAEQ